MPSGQMKRCRRPCCHHRSAVRILAKLEVGISNVPRSRARPVSGPPPRMASNAKESTIHAGSQVPDLGRAGHGGELKVEVGQAHRFPRDQRPPASGCPLGVASGAKRFRHYRQRAARRCVVAGGGRGFLQSWSGVGVTTPRAATPGLGPPAGRRTRQPEPSWDAANPAPLARPGGWHRSGEHQGTGRGRGTLGPRTHLSPSWADPRLPLRVAHPPAR